MEEMSAETNRLYLLLLLGPSASYPWLVLPQDVQGTGLWVHVVGARPSRSQSAPGPWPISDPSCGTCTSSRKPTTGTGPQAPGQLCESPPSLVSSSAHSPPTHSLPHTFSLTQSITHMQTSALTLTQTHTHKLPNVLTHSHYHIFTDSQAHVHSHSHIVSCSHTDTHSHTHSGSHTPLHSHIPTYKHIRTRTHTHTLTVLSPGLDVPVPP